MSSEDSSLTNNIKILPNAVVCNETNLRGDITIGSMSIVHPRASIIAEAGPIIIGENNLIEEHSQIINRLPSGVTPAGATPVLIIGSNNVFEVDCHCESLKIGDNNILECKSYIDRNVELTNGCVVGAGCKVSGPAVIPENTVIYGDRNSRRKMPDRPQFQALQLDFLHRVMPSYHVLRKPMRKGQGP